MQDGMYLTLCSSVLLQTLTPMPKFKGIILFSVWVPKCLKAFMRVFGIWKLSVCISMSASLLKISWHFLCLYCDCQCCSNNCLNVRLHKFKRELKEEELKDELTSARQGRVCCGVSFGLSLPGWWLLSWSWAQLGVTVCGAHVGRAARKMKKWQQRRGPDFYSKCL